MPSFAAVASLLAVVAAGAGAWLVACDSAGTVVPPDAGAAGASLMDPATCATCHADHYRAWSGSMHAYAADDPVFVAMNARGQRETNGALGDFCVQCHAPVASRLGLSRDGGANLAALPASARGVTCWFCHSVDAVTDTHDDALHLATDGVLRGGIADPLASGAHAAAYSPLHDRGDLRSAQLCGSCHDVRTPAGADAERTYAEWTTSVYAHGDVDAGTGKACGGCHMPASDGPAASVPGAPQRRVHDHAMPGVDLALTPFAEADAQRAAVQKLIDAAIAPTLCVAPGRVSVTLRNTSIGHAWPSGATHDRRAWVEIVAYAGGAVVWQSGATPAGQPLPDLEDPASWVLRERLFDNAGAPVRFLWQAAAADASTLPPRTPDVVDPAVTRSWDVVPAFDRVTARVLVTPIGPDVLDDLVASGDLSPQARANVPVIALRATALEWTPDRGMPACLP